MGKPYFLLLLFVLACGPAFAQIAVGDASDNFAVGGTSDNSNRVFWLTWDGNLAEDEYTWEFSTEVRIVAQVTNIEWCELRWDRDGNSYCNWKDGATIEPYTPGTWKGDGLGDMYSGKGGVKDHGDGVTSVLGVENSGLVTQEGKRVRFDIDLQLEFKVEGVWKDVVYPGMVIADAEEMNGSNEYISAEIKNKTNSTSWQLIDKRTAEGKDSTDYKLKFEANATKFKLWADGGTGNQAVLFARGATGLNNVEMKGGGKTALALGFVLPFDISTAAGYCEARHYIDYFQEIENNIIDDCEGNNDDDCIIQTNLGSLDETALTPSPTLYIGCSGEDCSGDPLDNNNVEGEELKINFTQEVISITVPVTNTKGVEATLYWWMDFNNDGQYDVDELETFLICPNTDGQNAILTFSKADFAGKYQYIGENLMAGPLHSRLRITTTTLSDKEPDDGEDDRSCAMSEDGEVEDYTFDVRGISISGTVFIDADGMEDEIIDNSFDFEGTESTIDFSKGFLEQLYAYLVVSENDFIVGKDTVDVDGFYEITNMNHGSYNLSMSDQDLPVGTAFSGEEVHLPPAWASVGESFGVDNAYVPEEGFVEVLDMRIPIETPNAGMDITGVNFGVDQPPFPKNDTVVSPAYRLVDVEVLKNDVDQQGYETIRTDSVVLLSSEGTPTEGQKIITDAGTFTVLADGRISFMPFNSFHGKTASIAYAVKDVAGLLSETAMLNIVVERPRMVTSNPMLPSNAASAK